MRRLPAFLFLLGLLVPALPARAHPVDPEIHPQVFQDIMRAPRQEGPYGMGYTSTERVVERCSALLWSVRHDKDGNVRSYRRNYQTGYCLGWINSSMAFLNFHNEDGHHTLGVCLPDELDSRHVIDVFLGYVHANHDHLKYNPSLLIYWALLEKYPCPK
ncbi:MAG: Rap1a/Tai family immunity protein [Xanthobacteraceae bacterium]